MARVTVINDYPDFVELMEAILGSGEGHIVTGLDAEESTLDQVLASRPDLLIIDLTPGESQGRWDPTKLRAVEALRETPIIFCSGDIRGLRERADELRNGGHTEILEKPFSLDELVTTVNSSLARS